MPPTTCWASVSTVSHHERVVMASSAVGTNAGREHPLVAAQEPSSAAYWYSRSSRAHERPTVRSIEVVPRLGPRRCPGDGVAQQHAPAAVVGMPRNGELVRSCSAAIGHGAAGIVGPASNRSAIRSDELVAPRRSRSDRSGAADRWLQVGDELEGLGQLDAGRRAVGPHLVEDAIAEGLQLLAGVRRR